MKAVTINGGRPLYGKIKVGGSKNAALPILFATLVTGGVNEIVNLPDIGDVRVALQILTDLGCAVESRGASTFIDTSEARYKPPRAEHLRAIRASTYLIGACLGRFGVCSLGEFGGCAFSDRPIDLHIFSAKSFGAVEVEDGLKLEAPHTAEISLRLPSVGATVNSLILAASVSGKSRIKGVAREPHVSGLIEFLRSAGAVIDEMGDIVEVTGGSLHGGVTEVIGDMLEGFTYLAAGLVTGGEISVYGLPSETLALPLEVLKGIGASVTVKEGVVTASAAISPRAVSVTATPYPGFPTDLQPILAPLLAVNAGGIITDRVFSDRFGYLSGLRSFGLRSSRINSGAVIQRSPLVSASEVAPDLRGGMALVLAGLAAKGKSRIGCADTVLRGYESPEEKLRSIGAEIKIVDE